MVSQKNYLFSLVVMVSGLGVGIFETSWMLTQELRPAVQRAIDQFPRCSHLSVVSDEYRMRLESVRKRIPEDGEYLLLDRYGGGAVVLVQGDLAPRRARLTDQKQLQKQLQEWQISGQSFPLITVVYTGEDDLLTVVDTTSLAIF